MPRPDYVSLQVLRTLNAVGDASVVERFRDKYVQFSGAFDSGQFQLQGSIDGSAWLDLSAAVATSACIRSVPETVRLLRLKTTAAAGSNCTVTATMMGFDNTALV